MGVRKLRDQKAGDRLFVAIEPGDQIKYGAIETEWKPGMWSAEDLGGARNLDGTKGPAPMEQGLLSRDGWRLLDDSTRVAERASAAGCDVTIEVWPKMQHVFQIAAGNVPESDSSVDKLGSWLSGHLSD